MSTGSKVSEALREQMSAMADGELEARDVAGACGRWRVEAELQSAWHTYHLIGDVLRSEDLAVEPARERAFLAALRDRLSQEPVVIAPQRAQGSATARDRTGSTGRDVQRDAAVRRWPLVASSAVAAGFVAVAGTYAFLRQSDVSASRSGPVEVATVERPAPVAVPVVAQTPEPTGMVVRDARLDAYLAAHKQFAGTSALGVPSTFLRSATMESSGR